jgi:hypothetical protein
MIKTGINKMMRAKNSFEVGISSALKTCLQKMAQSLDENKR